MSHFADLLRAARGAQLVGKELFKLIETGQVAATHVHWNALRKQGSPKPGGSQEPASPDPPDLGTATPPSDQPHERGPLLPRSLVSDPLPSVGPPSHEPVVQPSPIAAAVVGGGTRDAPSSNPTSSLSRQNSIPTHPVTRAMHFGGLGLGLAAGAAAAAVRRTVSGETPPSLIMSEANLERLTGTLCRLRGAALKVGQMLSFNNAEMLPPAMRTVMERVRSGADWMPSWQLHQTLQQELGEDWRSHLASFEEEPVAAASIGQVHKAVLNDGRVVAIKVQYPGVADSIQSDLWSMKQLVQYTGLVPPGLYLNKVLEVAREELLEECDYVREAENTRRFKLLLAPYPEFSVPAVVSNLSSGRVLTTEWMAGKPIDGAFKDASIGAHERDRIGSRLLWLCLMELCEFRFMQTDPNWSNFLYEPRTGQLSLIDFGACREYDAPFADKYLQMVRACAEGVAQREEILRYSRELEFLTGEESDLMLEAHVNAAVVVGSPFAAGAQPYDFATQDVSRRVSADVATMIKHRLTPPRKEIYSLHRRLNGCFQLASHVEARIPARDILLDFYNKHPWTDETPQAEG